MPYKVAVIEPNHAGFISVFALGSGFLGGFGLNKPSIVGVSPLIHLATFLSLAGLLGVVFNFARSIEGFPMLALLALLAGLGLFAHRLVLGRKHAS